MDEQSYDIGKIGEKLREARETSGLALDDVMREMWVRNLPSSMLMSRGKINSMERGQVAKPDPFDLLLLATIYDKPLDAISPQAAADIESYRQIVRIPRADSGAEGQGTRGSPCTPDRVLVAA